MRYKMRGIERILILSVLALVVSVFIVGGDAQVAVAQDGGGASEETCALSPELLEGLGRFSVTGQGRFSVTGLGRFTVTGLGRFSVTGLGRFSVTGLSAEEAALAEAEAAAIAEQINNNDVDVEAWVGGLSAQIAGEPTFGDYQVAILIVDDDSGEPVSHMDQVVAVVERALAATGNAGLFQIFTLDIGQLSNVSEIATAISDEVDTLLETFDRVVVNNSYTFLPCVYDGVDLEDAIEYINNAENVQPIVPSVFCASYVEGGWEVYFSYNSLNADPQNISVGDDNNVTVDDEDWYVSDPITNFLPGNHPAAFSVYVNYNYGDDYYTYETEGGFAPLGGYGGYDDTPPTVTWTLRGPDGVVRTASVNLAGEDYPPCYSGSSGNSLQEEFVCWTETGEGSYDLVYRVYNSRPWTQSTTPGATAPPLQANYFSPPAMDRGQPGDFPPGYTYFILSGYNGVGNITWHVRTGPPAIGNDNNANKECTDEDFVEIDGLEPNIGGVSIATYLQNKLGFTEEQIENWFEGASMSVGDDDLTPLAIVFAGFNELSATDAVKRVQSFAAAGNFGDLLGTNTTMFPASLPSVIAVSAEMPDGGGFGSWMSPFIEGVPPVPEVPSVELSQSGNIVAPGAWLEENSGLFGGPAYMAGTSFSTPLAAVIGGLWLTTDECTFYETHPFLVSDALPKTSNASLLDAPGGAPPFDCFNDPPEAEDDTYLIWYHQDRYLQVLNNDSDPDNDDLTIDSVTPASEGNVTINTDFVDDVLYYVHTAATPAPGGTSSDTFDYTITDGAATDTATVNLTIARLDLTCKVIGSEEITWEVYNPVDQSVAFLWDLNTGDDSGADTATSGYSTFTTPRLEATDTVKILVGGATGFAQQDEASSDECDPPVPECESDALGNLVVNGCFETPVIETPQGWDIYTTDEMNSWTVEWTEDNACPRETDVDEPVLELQKQGAAGITPPEGLQFAELDSDCQGPGGTNGGEYTTVVISQELPTTGGEWYKLSFMYRERNSTGTQTLEVRWDGNVITLPNNAPSNWTYFEIVIQAEDASTLLEFEDTGQANTFGILLDDVIVVPVETYRLRIQKWHDLDQDGRVDDGEERVPGWPMYVYNEDGDLVASGQTNSNGRINVWLPEGTYVVCEGMVEGWINTNRANSLVDDPEDWGRPCVERELDRNRTANLFNYELPTEGDLTIEKLIDWNGFDENNAVNFEICVSGLFPECKEANFANDYTVVWYDVEAGNYTFSETPPGASWAVDYPGGQTATVVGGENNTYYVENTYTPPGSITVTKQVEGQYAPDGATFQICVGGVCRTLGDGESETWDGLQPGNYEVSESDPGDYWSVNISNEWVQLGQGEDVYVTITNTFDPPLGSISVHKSVEGQYAPNQTFEICVGGVCKNFNAGQTRTWTGLPAGSYAVTETDPGQYWSVSGETTVELDWDGQESVTITNTFDPPLGSITVTKEVSGQDAPNQTFLICVDNDCKNFSAGQQQTWTGLPAGTYAVTENFPGAGWTVGGEQNVTLGWGEQKSVTITNTYEAPTTFIQVTKQVQGEGAPQGPFNICVNGVEANASYPGGNCVNLNAGESWSWTVKAGYSYAITEDDPGEGWSVSGETTVAVAVGQPVYITITNTYDAPDPQCTSDPSALSGWIDVGPAQASGYIRNNGALPFCGRVGMASYMKYDEDINNQILFAGFDMDVYIEPGQTITLNVGVPQCQAQVDLFWGYLIPDMSTGERYGERLLAAVHSRWLPYCVPREEIN